MAAELQYWTAVTNTKPRRIEGHTSNVEHPILYSEYITATLCSNDTAGDTAIIPHKITNPVMINAQPTELNSGNCLHGNGTTVGAHIAAPASSWNQITTAATAGASTVVLTGATDLADVYNFVTIDIRYASGNVQTVRVLDFAATSLTATLEAPLTESIATTGTYWRYRGSIMTLPTTSTTPTFKFEVIGTFE